MTKLSFRSTDSLSKKKKKKINLRSFFVTDPPWPTDPHLLLGSSLSQDYTVTAHTRPTQSVLRELTWPDPSFRQGKRHLLNELWPLQQLSYLGLFFNFSRGLSCLASGVLRQSKFNLAMLEGDTHTHTLRLIGQVSAKKEIILWGM